MAYVYGIQLNIPFNIYLGLSTLNCQSLGIPFLFSSRKYLMLPDTNNIQRAVERETVKGQHLQP